MAYDLSTELKAFVENIYKDRPDAGNVEAVYSSHIDVKMRGGGVLRKIPMVGGLNGTKVNDPVKLLYFTDNSILAVGTRASGETGAVFLSDNVNSHTHDERYYTQSSVDTFLARKSDISHSHANSSHVVAESGQIGGFLLKPAYLSYEVDPDPTNTDYSNKVYHGAGMSPTDWPFWAGSGYVNRSTAPFRVNPAGQVWATDATISGDITANTGHFGGATGWAVSANDLSTSSSTNKIRAVAAGLVSNDTGFYLQGDGKVRLGTANGLALTKGVYWDGSEITIKTSNFALSGGSLTASNATLSGDITASTGHIGGFEILSDRLQMDTGGVGLGAPSGSSWRFWAGNSNPALAPFRVSSSGEVWLENAHVAVNLQSSNYVTGVSGWKLESATGFAELSGATFRGTISASAGDLGGWTINSGYLGSTNVGLAPADYPFYAGAAYASRSSAPFRVDASGNLTATAANITGAINASSGSITGTLAVGASGVLIDGPNKRISSAVYSSGVNGWAINNDGSAEFGNVSIRGGLRAGVFEKGLITATAGSVWVTKSAGVLAADYAVGNTLTIKTPASAIGAWMFSSGDIIRIKAETTTGVGDTWIEVTQTGSVAATQSYTTTYKNGTNAVTYPAGTGVIDLGKSSTGWLAMTADESNSPFYAVRTSEGSPWTDAVEKIRLGNLSGISDADFGGALSGYGLYAQNVYLKGKIIIASGSSGYTNMSDKPTSSTGKVIVAPSPGTTAGLYLGSTNLGYFDGTNWKTYMDSGGKFYLGGTTGSLQWDGSALTVQGAIKADTGYLKNLDITGTIKTGASPNARIEITSTQIAGYSSGNVRQFYINAADGKAYAGGDAVTIDASGVTVTTPSTTFIETNGYKFSGGGGLYANSNGAAQISLRNAGAGTTNNFASVYLTTPTGGDPAAYLSGQSSTAYGQVCAKPGYVIIDTGTSVGDGTTQVIGQLSVINGSYSTGFISDSRAIGGALYYTQPITVNNGASVQLGGDTYYAWQTIDSVVGQRIDRAAGGNFLTKYAGFYNISANVGFSFGSTPSAVGRANLLLQISSGANGTGTVYYISSQTFPTTNGYSVAVAYLSVYATSVWIPANWYVQAVFSNATGVTLTISAASNTTNQYHSFRIARIA